MIINKKFILDLRDADTSIGDKYHGGNEYAKKLYVKNNK